MKNATRVLSLCLATLLIVSLGCQGSKVKSSSPKAAFNNVQNAAKAKDWDKFCGCITPKSLDTLAGGMSMMGSMMDSMPGMDDDMKKQLKSAIEGSGVTEKDFENLNLASGDDSEIQKLGAKVKNKPALIGTMMSVLEKMQEKNGGNGPGGVKFPEGELGEATVDGDSATAKFKSKDGKETEIKFEKIDGSWLVDLDMNQM